MSWKDYDVTWEARLGHSSGLLYSDSFGTDRDIEWFEPTVDINKAVLNPSIGVNTYYLQTEDVTFHVEGLPTYDVNVVGVFMKKEKSRELLFVCDLTDAYNTACMSEIEVSTIGISGTPSTVSEFIKKACIRYCSIHEIRMRKREQSGEEICPECIQPTNYN